MKTLVTSGWLVMVIGAMGIGVLGCGPIYHEEMLTESINAFSANMKGGASDRLWVTGPADSACDAGCCGSAKGGAKSGALGGLFGGGKSDGASSYDKLAYEVFSNYLTQQKKAAVVETHRHNYATELNPETHRKIDVVLDHDKVSTTSCEDLCLLDEAKKRKATKVLAYHIIEMKEAELTIHFRLSDVVTGIVELSQTLRVFPSTRAIDVSFGTTGTFRAGGNGGGGGAKRKHREASTNDD